MKAFQFRKYKNPLELTDIPVPQIGSDEVLVRVVAAGVNQLDEMIRQGTFKATLPYALPLTIGSDLSGEVTQVGSRVSDFKVGDLVFGKADVKQMGTFAEFAAVKEADLALKPNNLNEVEAAALPLVTLTAWQALAIRGKVAAGQKVLIHGGAGGVGSIAIQIAKHLGAFVASTASPSNVEFVQGLGADQVIDYKKQNFAEILKGFDLVLDTQGGETLMKSFEILKPGGKVIGIAGPPDVAYARSSNFNPVIRTIFKLLSSKVVKRAAELGVTYEFLFVESNGSQLKQIAKLVESGALKPILGREFAFGDIPDALIALAAGEISRGKAVINFTRIS